MKRLPNILDGFVRCWAHMPWRTLKCDACRRYVLDVPGGASLIVPGVPFLMTYISRVA